MRQSSQALLALTVIALLTFPSLAGAAPIILGKHYEETVSNGCSNKINCSVAFSPVPVGKKLTITRLACSIRASKNVVLLRVRLVTSPPLVIAVVQQDVEPRF